MTISPRWPPVAAVLLSLLACSDCRRSGAPPDAPDAAVPPGEPIDAGTAAALSPREVPSAASTLAYLEDSDAGCAFVRAEPSVGARRILAELPEACVGARVAWPSAPDAAAALVWFDPAAFGGSSLEGAAYPLEENTDAGTPSGRLYRVDLLAGSSQPLPPLPADRGETQELGFAGGKPTVLTLSAVKARAGSTVSFEGAEYTFDQPLDGMPALAHALQLEGGVWRTAETKATSEGSEGALGVRALETFGALGPRSSDLLVPHAQGDVVEDEATRAQLEPASPRKGEGMWIFLGSEAGRFFVWEEQIELPFTMGRVVFPVSEADGGTRFVQAPELGFTHADFVAVRARGPYVLVSEADTGRHARLYDARTGALVWKSDAARAVTFWPGAYVERREHQD